MGRVCSIRAAKGAFLKNVVDCARRFARVACAGAVAFVCLIGSNVVTPFSAFADENTNADLCPTQSVAAKSDDWRKTECATNPDGAIRKPVLHRMLAMNNKLDTLRDELRIDFVMRVAHGEVNPYGTTPEAIGMKLRFDFGDGGVGLDGTVYPDYNYVVGYKNTYSDPSTPASDTVKRANTWARNIDEYYTIPKIMHAGLYDYVVISMHANIDTPDEPSLYWTSKDKGGVSTNNDGHPWKQHIWVEVGPPAISAISNLSSTMASKGLAWSGPTALKTNELLAASPLVGDMADNETVMVYPGSCYVSVKHGCDIPNTWVGFDAWPSLWSLGQANWGMITDKGIGGYMSSMGGIAHDPPLTQPGVAPPNSFFVSWYNPALGLDTSNPCYQVTGFKYQWIGLKDNRWVPVDALTPTAQTVTGMPVAGALANSGSFVPVGLNGKALVSFANRSFDAAIAFNSNVDYDGDPTSGRLIVPNAGQSGVAQAADGSIDFNMAKRQQGLDGYFKLVTWPIVNQACTVEDPLRNPDPASEGITDDLARTNPEAAEQRINQGWTMDTAFFNFDIVRPQAPLIDSFKGYASAKSRTVKGTAIPGYLVTVFAEDPDNPINPNNPNDPNTKGRKIGTVKVSPTTGDWSIKDMVSVDISKQALVRYHAWQSDDTSINVTSLFSNIVPANFHLTMNSNPEIKQVYAPHTVMASDGPDSGKASLQLGGKPAKVMIKGSINSANHKEDILRVFAVPLSELASATAKDAPSSTGGGGETSPSGGDDDDSVALNGLKVPDSKYLVGDLSNGCSQSNITQVPGSGTDAAANPVQWQSDWSCAIDPSVFPTQDNPNGSVVYSIYAVLQDIDGGKPAIGRVVNQVIDMVPPVVKIASANRAGGVRGIVKLPEMASSPALPDDEGYRGAGGLNVTLIWPDGSKSVPVKTENNGSWKVPIPENMPEGNVGVFATDRSGVFQRKYNINTPAENLPIGAGNDSNLVTCRIADVPLTNALPFTGGFQVGELLLAAGIVVLLLAVFLALLRFKNCGTKGLHAMR